MGADVKLRRRRQPSRNILPLSVLLCSLLALINGYTTDLMSVPERIPIGAIFPLGHNNLHTIFKQAIHTHNSNASQKFIVETAVEFVDSNDPTRVVRQCLFQLQELLKHSHRSEHSIQLSTIKRISNAGEGYKLLKSLDREKKDSMKYVILNCNLHITKALIAYHIQDTAMERSTFHYLLTNILLSEMWSKEVPAAFNSVNITSFALPSDRNELKKLVHIKKTFRNEFGDDDMPSLEEALAMDATQVLLSAFHLIMQSQINITKAMESESVVSTVNFTRNTIDPTCPTLKPFKLGDAIASHLKITSRLGITGNIEFHSSGSRKNYSIEIFEISNNGLFEKIALWSDLLGLTVLHPNRLRINDRSTLFSHNMTFAITTILEEPFLMLRNPHNGHTLKGNDRYEGFVKDFVDSLAKENGFQFKFRIVNDSKYGAPDPQAKAGWNGMIGELIRNEVDLAIAPLTITPSRIRVVDFSLPFMTTGMSLMAKKPTLVAPDMLAFVRPMAKEVWASIIIAIFGVTLIFYIVSKLSSNKAVREKAPERQNISLCASLSYSLGVLLYQVSGVYPHSMSSRIVSFVWWLFVFITITSYLANLTANSVTTTMKFTLFNVLGKYESLSDAFVYYDQMTVPISSVEDLAKQNVLEYGTLRDSSTQSFFKRSQIGVYQTMWQKMQSMNNVLVDSYSEGVKKVRNSEGQYVFILEAPMNNYVNDRWPCNTFKVGNNFHAVDYGIAFPVGSPLKKPLNEAVVRLKEKGEIAKLESKWWGERSQCRLYDIKELSNTTITLNNIFVGLVVLTVGLIFAFLVSIVEHLCNRKVSYDTRQSNYTITRHDESFEEEDRNSAKRRIIPKE